MTDDQLRLLNVMADPCSYPPGRTREREAIAAALEEIERLRAAESNFLTFGQGGADYRDSQWIAKLAETEQSRDREIERLKAERDRLIAGCLLDPWTWTEKTMAVMEGEVYWRWQYGGHYGIAETREVALKAVRKAVGLEDEDSVRAVLDQAARDTAAVAGRERAGEAIGGETMEFRMRAP